MDPWVTSIWRALRPSGGRRALTASETASMPVSEDPPFANALSSTYRYMHTGQLAERLTDQPGDDHEDDRPGKQVGRQCECPAGFPDPAKVPVTHDQDRDHRDNQQAVMAAERGERRYDRRTARSRLHGNGDHIVDQQRYRGNLGDARAEVLPGHHIRAARPGVDRHHLAVEQHDKGDSEEDNRGHRQHNREGRRVAKELDELDQDLFCAIGSGGDAVAGQHAEGQRP